VRFENLADRFDRAAAS